MVAAKTAIPGLTGLRFYAAAIILYCHTLVYFYRSVDPAPIVDTVALGSIGMTLFFVLSGFVIHYNYGVALSEYTKSSLWSFVVARFARLYPLYILAFAFSVAFLPNAFGDPKFCQTLPFYLTLCQSWLPIVLDGQLIYTFHVGQAWSISAEVLLYVLYIPLVGVIGAFRSMRALLAVTAVVLVVFTIITIGRTLASQFTGTFDHYYFFYISPYCRFPEFLLGVLTAAIYQKRAALKPTWHEQWPLFAASFALIVILFLATYTIYGHLFRLAGYSWGFAPGCAGLMYYFARSPGRLSWMVENKAVVVLGDASYSIYMLSGWPLWMFSANGASPNYQVATVRASIAWLFLLFLAFGVYHYFEVPMRRFLRNAMGARLPFRIGTELGRKAAT